MKQFSPARCTFTDTFNKTDKTIITALALTLLSACGSDSTSPVPLTGVFLDSAVAGLNYETDSQSGITDNAGTFTYNPGETVTFSIGTLNLPPVTAAPFITPLELFAASSVTSTPVTNLGRLLQSLDADSNNTNGIQITREVSVAVDRAMAAMAPTTLDFSSTQFDTQAMLILQETGNQTLVDSTTAQAHLQQTLTENNLSASNCGNDHPLVGRQAEFETFFHDVSGTLTVLDDCTLEVTNFRYDGQGPAVYFYAGVNRIYTGSDTFIMGPMLNGPAFDNVTLRLDFPNGKSLDDFDSLSVWCADFSINFGDAFFGDS